jgi:hypothetical protein
MQGLPFRTQLKDGVGRFVCCPELRLKRFPPLYQSTDRKRMFPASGGCIIELQDCVRGPHLGTFNSIHGLLKELGIPNTEFPF